MIRIIAWKAFILSMMLVACYYLPTHAQTVTEITRAIKTYPFSDANPIPSMGVNNNIGRFYPYFMFDAYSNKDTLQKWK